MVVCRCRLPTEPRKPAPASHGSTSLQRPQCGAQSVAERDALPDPGRRDDQAQGRRQRQRLPLIRGQGQQPAVESTGMPRRGGRVSPTAARLVPWRADQPRGRPRRLGCLAGRAAIRRFRPADAEHTVSEVDHRLVQLTESLLDTRPPPGARRAAPSRSAAWLSRPANARTVRQFARCRRLPERW